MGILLPFGVRLVITVLAVLAASYLVGIAWDVELHLALPSYAAGLVGGLVALPVWGFLKWIRPPKR